MTCYIHAADPRLDAPFLGLPSHLSAETSGRICHAAEQALSRLVSLCRREQPDFLLFTGALFDAKGSPEACRRLSEACETLHGMGIPVFAAGAGPLPAGLRPARVEGHEVVLDDGTAHPFVEAGGPLQGLRLEEDGPHGCLVVRIQPHLPPETRFEALAPVEWRTVEVDLGCHAPQEPDNLPESAQASIMRAIHAQAAALGPGCELLLLCVRLVGATPYNAELRDPEYRTALLERLASVSGVVTLLDPVVHTRPLFDREAALREPSFTARFLQHTDALRHDPQALCDAAHAALAPLFNHPRCSAVLPPLTNDALRELLESAEALCLEELSPKRPQEPRADDQQEAN